MTMRKPRAYKAGEDIAKAIIEMVHLMYQNNTANHFYAGLKKKLSEEIERRHLTGRSSRLEKDSAA